MKTPAKQDKILLYRLKTGKNEAFAEVYDVYAEKIYRYIYFKVSTKQEAEDLTSEAFLETWDYINKGKKVDNIQALLYKIARNLIVDHYRKKAPQESISLDERLGYDEPVVEVESIPEQIDQELALEQIEKALKQIKDEYRDIIILKYVEDLSIQEIANILNKSKGAVRVLVHRALKALQDVVEKG